MTQVSEHKKARAERWLDERIKRGRKEYFGEHVSITPELAELLLLRNDSNRSLSVEVAAKYAEDIMAGRWAMNGEPLIISETGELNDGQHRCKAVIISGRPIQAIVVFGVTRESRLTVNTGKARTVGDFLAMEGHRNSNNIAAIASVVYEVLNFGRITSGLGKKPTKQQVLEFALNTPEIADSFHAVHKAGAQRVCTLTVLGAAHFFMAKANASAAEVFIDHLISGAGLSDKSPILVCRTKLMARDLRLNNNERLKTIFSAWNNWRDGRGVKSLVHSFKGGEMLPELRK